MIMKGPEMHDARQARISRRSLLGGMSALGCSLITTAVSGGVTRVWAAPPGSAQQATSVLFDDTCENLGQAGWLVDPNASPGAFIVDHPRSVANPLGVSFPELPAGKYLIHGNPLAGIHNSADTMAKPLDMGAGAWRVSFSLRIDGLMTPHRLPQSSGLRLWVQADDLVRGGRYYDFSFTHNAEILLVMAGGAYQSAPVPGGWDGESHNWEIRFDGIQTIRVTYDGTEIAAWTYSGGTASITEGITFYNRTLEGIEGTNDVYLDRITVSRDDNVILLDDASQWTNHWAVPPITSNAAYVTDHGRSTGFVDGMSVAPAGRYFLYAKSSGAIHADLRTPIPANSDQWIAEIIMRFPQFAPGNSGDAVLLGLDVVVAGRRYLIGWNRTGNLAVSDVNGTLASISASLPKDAVFHTWRFGKDRHGRVFAYLDDRLLGFVDAAGTPTTDADRVRLVVRNPASSGAIAVWVEAIKIAHHVEPLWFTPSFGPIGIDPRADAHGLDAAVTLLDFDPLWLADGHSLVTWELSHGDEVLDSGTIAQPTATCRFRPKPRRTGLLTLTVSLNRDGRAICGTAKQIRIAPKVNILSAGDSARHRPAEDYLFLDMSSMNDSSWTAGSYHIVGLSDPGQVIRSGGTGGRLEVPVRLTGQYAISIGLLSDTEGARVWIGDDEVLLHESSSTTSATGLIEKFVATADLTGKILAIAPVEDAMVSLVYFRFRCLSGKEIRLAARSNEGPAGKRVIYNNDGNADIVLNRVTDEATLRLNSVRRYENKDVGYLAYGMGATTMMYHNSEFAGTVQETYEFLTPAQHALMRSADIKTMNFMLSIVTDEQAPIGIVANEAKQIGVRTLASLRMSAFYDPAVYPWLNGPRFAEMYDQYKMIAFEGTPPSDPSNRWALSLTHAGYRDYVKNILAEVCEFGDVDGIELDFCRRPKVLGWGDEFLTEYENRFGVSARQELTGAGLDRLLKYRASIMIDLLAQIRATLPDKTIAVRVPYSYCYEYGLDVATWVDRKLIDVLIPSVWSLEDFWTIDDEFPSLVAGTRVKLYGGIEAVIHGLDSSKAKENLSSVGISSQVASSRMNRQQYLLRTMDFYRAGYDGVYIFNNPQGESSLGILGDRVAVEKWYEFSYPSELVRNSVEVTL